MFEMKLPCPSCQTVLKVTDPTLIGRMIRCPRCQTAVQIPGGAPAEASRPAPARPMAAARRAPAAGARPQDLEAAWADQEPEEQGEERPTRRAQPAAKKGGGFFGFLIFLLALAYIGAVVVLYLDLVKIPLPGLG